MLATGFEFIADEADPIEIDPHSEFFILLLYLSITGTFLCQCLMVQGQGKHDVGPDLSSVEFAVKTAKLDRVVAMEETVQVEKVVSAVMVVACLAAAITGVPDFLKLFERSWLLLIHAFDQIGVHLFAVAHTLRLDLKCFIEQIISAGDEVDEVTNTSGGMRHTVEMYMDTTGAVCDAACLAQTAYNALQSSNVFPIGQNGADQFTGML